MEWKRENKLFEVSPIPLTHPSGIGIFFVSLIHHLPGIGVFLHFFVSLIHHLPGIGICHTILICVKLVFIFDICSSVTHSIKFAFAIHAECNNFHCEFV